jgi:hypothetical protein
MQKAAMSSDISNTASEEEKRFNKILGIQGQAFIKRERGGGGFRASFETSKESSKQ